LESCSKDTYNQAWEPAVKIPKIRLGNLQKRYLKSGMGTCSKDTHNQAWEPAVKISTIRLGNLQ